MNQPPNLLLDFPSTKFNGLNVLFPHPLSNLGPHVIISDNPLSFYKLKIHAIQGKLRPIICLGKIVRFSLFGFLLVHVVSASYFLLLIRQDLAYRLFWQLQWFRWANSLGSIRLLIAFPNFWNHLIKKLDIILQLQLPFRPIAILSRFLSFLPSPLTLLFLIRIYAWHRLHFDKFIKKIGFKWNLWS